MEDQSPLADGHIPVMVAECLALLNPAAGEVMVDGTLGLGGHSLRLAEAVGPTGRVIGVDRDPSMLDQARARLAGQPVECVHANFSELDTVLSKRGMTGVDGILLDLGVASPQIDDAARGFSYRGTGPLDMRMTPREGISASDWINRAPQEEVARVIYEYGEERMSRRIARVICEARERSAIRTTTELAEIIRRAVPSGPRRLHPARRAFQGIRIFVNREIEHLERFLAILPDLLNPGGRCVVISYHSLEDRPVKQAFRAGRIAGAYEILTRKPVRPSAEETRVNPRSRSAKVRAVRRIGKGTDA